MNSSTLTRGETATISCTSTHYSLSRPSGRLLLYSSAIGNTIGAGPARSLADRPGRPETPCPITSHSQNEGPVHNWVYIEESVTTLKEMKYGGTIMIMQSAMKRQMS